MKRKRANFCTLLAVREAQELERRKKEKKTERKERRKISRPN